MTMNFLHTIKALVLLFAVGALTGCGQGPSVDARVEEARNRTEGPALWKVSDHNSTLYLYGTVHLLPDDTDWQRMDMQIAFDEVGTVFFEIPDNNQAALDASTMQRTHGRYTSGLRLSDHLGSLNQKLLFAAAHNADIPAAALDNFKPWLVTDMLMIAAAEKAGLKAENSADTVLRAKAKAAQKSIKTLDTMSTYIEAVALQPDYVQMQALEDTIANFDTLSSDIERVNAAWLIGDINSLETDLILPAKQRSPELYKALFSERNKKWARTLDVFLQGDGSGMAVVGIGHLVGTDGLPDQMIELGYDVERVRRYDVSR